MTAPVLFLSTVFKPDIWLSSLKSLSPGLAIQVWPDADVTPEAVRYAVVWRPPHGVLRTFPNLACVFSLGAGVDAIVSDPDYPRHVPLSRMIDPTLTQAMTEYVVLHVLYNHRRQRDFEALQRLRKWRALNAPRAEQVRVGIMGLGVLGTDAAQKLVPLGYQLSGWSMTRKHVPGVRSFCGQPELPAFLAQTDILVCLLPLTPETQGILNRSVLSQLPKGASLINAARGAHMVPEDVLALLDEGLLSGATLDVFPEEPLPPESQFWTHPKVTLTPHAAAATDPRAISRHIVETIAAMERGGAPGNLVDLSKGY
ncbi:MAG TPA: glyoxylate/hydroxypyruvate reductase A [Alphaproteobacteria bacterium]|nr:glyoxylate/hydroxypyruvate reductase A [Alphaproteobacteria bacterium]HAJ45158.1 glyoxylate/hydroxypyruvate reductase A [Alphaproteobacteria bacterium]